MTGTPQLAPDGAARPRAPRWMRLLLAASLAVNLAVLGLVGGTVAHRALDRHRPAVRDIGFGPFSDALSPQDRQELRRAFLRDGGNPRDMRRQTRTEAATLLQALRADPLPEAALRDAFRQAEERGQERLHLGHRLLADRIIAMSPEDRARFADRLEKRMMPGDMRRDPAGPGE